MTRLLWGALALGLAMAGCDGEAEPSDGGMADAASAPCVSAGCDDGVFCNGEERCLPMDPSADAQGCVPAADAACADGCDEEQDMCLGCATPDADGDGVDSIACGGDDCDDDDASRFPGNIEICDADDVDEDCDPTTLGPDIDGDGFAAEECCNGDVCGRDCDDAVAGVNPGASDSCGGGDQDCDGEIDEEPDSVFFRDQDSDNFGTDDDTLAACSQPPGYVARGGDCSDDPFADPNANVVNPGVTEICNERDDNCDLRTDEDLNCACTTPGEMRDCSFDPALDGVGICRLGSQTCTDGVFTSCVGETPPGIEVCNFDDDDCDGEMDEGVEPRCWVDADGDGFAAEGAAELAACECPANYTATNPEDSADCDDGSASVHPGATELCNRVDDDCSGGSAAVEDRDDDGFTAVGFDQCEGGFPKTDCYDLDNRVRPNQGAYFGEGRCPSGSRPCNGACTDDPLTHCIFGGAPGPIPADDFDYDCRDGGEPQPSASACSMCRTMFACSGGGPSYTGSAPACGASVSQINCLSGGCTNTCSTSGPSTGPMPCH